MIILLGNAFFELCIADYTINFGQNTCYRYVAIAPEKESRKSHMTFHIISIGFIIS